MRYSFQSAGLDGTGAPEIVPLFGPANGCDGFDQRLLRFSASGDAPDHGADDEVLYVISGRGHATLAGESVELTPGTAAYLAADQTWSVDEADELVVLSVLVHDPLPCGASSAVLRVDDEATRGATAGRQFRLLSTPEVGCKSVTQFLGIIPVGRAPDHFHLYDEVVYVLRGNGALHVDGESAQLTTGSCVHLPARLVHCLENVGPDEMHVLGVFRPAGSPAEAYYADGTAAQVPGD